MRVRLGGALQKNGGRRRAATLCSAWNIISKLCFPKRGAATVKCGDPFLHDGKLTIGVRRYRFRAFVREERAVGKPFLIASRRIVGGGR